MKNNRKLKEIANVPVVDSRTHTPVAPKINKLESLEDFRALPEGMKVHSIINAKICHYIMIKENPKLPGNFIMLSTGNYTEVVNIKPNFDAKRNCWFIDYNSKEVGEIIIAQVECLIESYKQIFFYD